MPAEWETQQAIWLSWPHNVETWPDNLPEAQQEFVDFAQTIAESQNVFILCGKKHSNKTLKDLAARARVQVVNIPTNDAWIRDYGPTFVIDDSADALVAVDWYYNAWGGKYPPFDLDQIVGDQIAEYLGIKCLTPDLCFEGGAIEVNSDGIALTTESCALDSNRNAGRTPTDIEHQIKDSLGMTEILWLPGEGIEGDDTDGHIDQLARFTSDNEIVYAWANSPRDNQRMPLSQNLESLKSEFQSLGEDIGLIPLPVPTPIHLYERRVPASYCNFLICNQVVVVPQFHQPATDQHALETLAALFPDREVVGLSSIHLSVGLGSFHCLSQQQPKIETFKPS